MIVGDDARALLEKERALRLLDLELGPDPGDLTVWVDGTRLDDEWTTPDTGLEALDTILGKSREIVVRPGCRRYSIVFCDYVSFAVRDESYTTPEPEEDFSTPLRTHDTSAFLTFVTQGTFAETVLETPVRHISVVTLDDVIDVAVTEPPRITSRVLTASDVWADLDMLD